MITKEDIKKDALIWSHNFSMHNMWMSKSIFEYCKVIQYKVIDVSDTVVNGWRNAVLIDVDKTGNSRDINIESEANDLFMSFGEACVDLFNKMRINQYGTDFKKWIEIKRGDVIYIHNARKLDMDSSNKRTLKPTITKLYAGGRFEEKDNDIYECIPYFTENVGGISSTRAFTKIHLNSFILKHGSSCDGYFTTLEECIKDFRHKLSDRIIYIGKHIEEKKKQEQYLYTTLTDIEAGDYIILND